MREFWSCYTEIGLFTITKQDNKYILRFGDKILGTYDKPADAADALHSGNVGIIDLPSGKKVDTFDLDTPIDINRWSCVRQQF